jgi:hypothetical protein
VERRAVQTLNKGAAKDGRTEPQDGTYHRLAPWGRPQALVPLHRLQAAPRVGRRRGGEAGVRPQPLGADCPGSIPCKCVPIPHSCFHLVFLPYLPWCTCVHRRTFAQLRNRTVCLCGAFSIVLILLRGKPFCSALNCLDAHERAQERKHESRTGRACTPK